MNYPAPKREVVKLPPAPSTRSVEVVSCQDESTCNLQIMFDSGFRISVPILDGDTKDTLRSRVSGLIEQYRPASGSSYEKIVQIVTKSISESMCDSDGKVNIIASRVTALIPRWEVNLFWNFLEELKIPVEYEDAIEVMAEMGISAPLAESTSLQTEERTA
jgi:hypothetical protein